MGDKGLDAYLNEKVKTLGKAVDDIYSGKTPFKEYMPSGPQDPVNPNYAIKNLIVGNQPGIPPSKQPQKAYDFKAEAFAIKEYARSQAEQASRPKNQYAQAYSYNTDPSGGAFYDRYSNWQNTAEEFDKVGFHPLRDNEFNFNTQGNSSFINQAGLVMNQTLLGATTGVSSMVKMFRGDFFGQNGNEAEQYARNSALGNSTKSGVGGFMNNLVLNFGYTAGIMSGALGENLVGMAMGAFSKSVGAAKTLKTFSQVGKGIAKSADDAIDGGRVLSQGLEDLNDLNNVRTLHNATQPGKFQKFMQSGITRGLNPLSNATDLYYDVYKATDNISGLAKNAATFSQTAGALYRDIRTINLALSESRLEGGMVENTVADKLYNEYFAANGKAPSVQEQHKMQDQAKHAGFETAVFNSGLIYLTNKITFGNILNPRYASQGIFGKSLRDFATIGGEKGFGSFGKIVFNNTKHEFELVKNNFKTYLKGLKTDTFANSATKTVGYLKANISEGFQESAQEIISKANENYYLETYNSNAVKSQLYSRALFGIGSTPANYYGKEVGNQFNAQGAETFASGFFMGILGGGLNTSAEFLYNSGNKIFKPKQYEAYKKQKEELTTGMISYLNKFGAKQYMDSKLMTLGAEAIAADVIGKGSKKEVMDTESENLINHMTTLLERGGFSNFIDSFESFLEETDEEFEDSFKTVPKGEAAKYKTRLRDTITKARDIEKRFNYFKLKYPNPINLEEFDKDDLGYDNAVLMHEAWNLGVRNAVFYGESYDDTQKRMVEIIDKHYEQRPLKQLSKRDSDIIMDTDQMGQEIKYLETEIVGLSELKDPESKRLSKEKGKKLAALKEYKEAHTAFDLYFHRDRYIPNAKALIQKTKGKDAEITDKEVDAVLNEYLGEVSSKDEVALLKNLKAKYNKLMKNIGDISNGVVFDNKLDESFNLVLDFYKLNDEGKKLANQINLLNDPKSFIEIYNNNYAWMQKMYAQKSKYYEKVIKEQLDIIENNALLNSLADEGIYMSSEDFVLFLTNQIPPTEFFDQAQGLVIPEGSQAYERYYAKLKQLQDLKTDDDVDLEDTQTDLRQRIEDLKQRRKEAIRKLNLQFKNELKIETGKTEEELNKEDNLNENVITAEAIDIEMDMLKEQKKLIQTSIDIEDLNDLYANFIERNLFTEEEFNSMQDNVTPAQKTKARAIIKELNNTIEDEGLKNQIAVSKVLLDAAINDKLKTLSVDIKTAPKKGERSVEKTKAWEDYQNAVKIVEDKYNDLVAKARALTKQVNKENAPKDPVIIKESYDKKLKDLETKKQKEIDALEKEAVRSNVKNIIPKGKNKTLTIFEIAEALAIDEYVEVNYKGSKEIEPLIFYKDANGDLREGDAQGEILELESVPVVFTEASKFNYEQKPNQEKLKEIEDGYKVSKDAIIDTYNDDKQIVDEVEDFVPITPKSNLNTEELRDFRNMLYEKYALENEEIEENDELDEQKFKEWYSLPQNKVYFDTYNKSEPSTANKKNIVINFNNTEIDTEGLELPALIEYRDKINNEITTLEEENLTTTEEKLKQDNKDDIRALRTNLRSLNTVIEKRQFDNFSPKIQQSIIKIQKLLNDQKGVEPGVLLTEDDEVTKLKKGQKAYRINGEIHRRTTNVIQEVIEDDYSYDGVKEIQKIFDLTIAKKGLNSKSIEEFISGLEDLLSVDSSKLPGINSLLLNQIKKELKSLDGKSIEQINLEKEQKKISDQIDSINKKIVKFDELGEDTKVQNLIGQRNELTPILAELDAKAKGKAVTTTDTTDDIEKQKESYKKQTKGTPINKDAPKGIKIGDKYDDRLNIIAIEESFADNFDAKKADNNGQGYGAIVKVIEYGEMKNGAQTKAPKIETIIFNNKADADAFFVAQKAKLDKYIADTELAALGTDATADIEAKKVDIAERKKKSFSRTSVGGPAIGFNYSTDSGQTGTYYFPDGTSIPVEAPTEKEVREKINARYAAELKELESKPSTKTVSTEPINVNTTFDIIMHMITEESFEDGRIAGNLADDAKDYLESGKKLPFNEKLITPEAYKSLFEFLDQIKKEVDEGRMYLIGRDLVVYDSNIIKADEKKDRIAGEIDLLVATEEGIMIIDIKTGTVSKWKKFNAIKKDKNDKVFSKREEYTLQQGVYATLLEKQIDAPVVGIMLLPIERTSDPVTNKVTSISAPTAKSVFTKLKYKKDAKGNYIRNEGANKLEFEETTETPSKWFIPLYREPIQDKLDILIPPGTVRFIPGLNDAIDRQMNLYVKVLDSIPNEVNAKNTERINKLEETIYEYAEKNGIKVSNKIKDLIANKKQGLDTTKDVENVIEEINENEEKDVVKIPEVDDVLYFKNGNFDEYTVKKVNKDGLITLVDKDGKENKVRLETINKDYLTEEEMMSDESQDEAYVPTAAELKLARESVNSVEDFTQNTTLLNKEYAEAITKTPEQIRKELLENAKNCI